MILYNTRFWAYFGTNVSIRRFAGIAVYPYTLKGFDNYHYGACLSSDLRSDSKLYSQAIRRSVGCWGTELFDSAHNNRGVPDVL